ncbi:MAG TPA: hypothetical protein VKQ36_10500 [Ktedonobacterales bacterium]|nr:hypothetical protein [Ktedonobacterales bacterium]
MTRVSAGPYNAWYDERYHIVRRDSYGAGQTGTLDDAGQLRWLSGQNGR